METASRFCRKIPLRNRAFQSALNYLINFRRNRPFLSRVWTALFFYSPLNSRVGGGWEESGRVGGHRNHTDPSAVAQHATAVGKEWGEYEQNHLSPWGHLLQNKLK